MTVELTDEDVAEFRALYRRETGREITADQAREYATNVIGLVTLVYRIGTRW